VPHRAVANLLASAIEKTGFNASDTIVAVSTISFDIAAFEVFGPLVAGGRAVIADGDTVRVGFAPARLIDEHKAARLTGTPPLCKMLLEAGFTPRADLRMHSTGEGLQRDLADQLVEGGPLWNLYGPTETTIWCSLGPVAADGPIVIGDPVANTQLHVVDE